MAFRSIKIAFLMVLVGMLAAPLVLCRKRETGQAFGTGSGAPTFRAMKTKDMPVGGGGGSGGLYYYYAASTITLPGGGF